MKHIPGLFITGADTGVGKTYVASLIARQLTADGRKVGVYKPAASGCSRQGGRLVSDDAVALWDAAGRPGEFDRVCPQCFEAPLAPHLAARAEGRRLDADLLRRGLEYWRERSEIILVEGVGGLMSPLGDDEYIADLAEEFGFPLVVVSRNVLGTICQTLQTLITAAVYHGRGIGMLPLRAKRFSDGQTVTEAVKYPGRGLFTAGVVLNHPTAPSADDVSLPQNRAELAARCVPPILAEVGWAADDFDAPVDWFSLAVGS